jgi:hypothetical protein
VTATQHASTPSNTLATKRAKKPEKSDFIPLPFRQVKLIRQPIFPSGNLTAVNSCARSKAVELVDTLPRDHHRVLDENVLPCGTIEPHGLLVDGRTSGSEAGFRGALVRTRGMVGKPIRTVPEPGEGTPMAQRITRNEGLSNSLFAHL